MRAVWLVRVLKYNMSGIVWKYLNFHKIFHISDQLEMSLGMFDDEINPSNDICSGLRSFNRLNLMDYAPNVTLKAEFKKK